MQGGFSSPFCGAWRYKAIKTMNSSRPSILKLLALFVCLTTFVGRGAAQTTFAPGKYAGKVVIENLNACEEFGWASPHNGANGKGSTDAFLTVSEDGAVLKIQYDEGNTEAANWFETKAGTLTLAPGHAIGGIRHRSMHYFDVEFRYIAATGKYVGTGTWIIQDTCEGKAPAYPVTITLTRKSVSGAAKPSSSVPSKFHACFVNSGSVASAGPCVLAPGSLLWVRMSKHLPNPPATLTFKAALAHGVPAAVSSPLSGSGQYYSTAVPTDLCAAGTGGKWDIFLLDGTGQLWGNIGRLTTDCRAYHR
jgi:hypothetical protein